MIDLHCHLLPAIDDGPDTLSEALDLARLALANGIEHSVVTPHIHPGRYENERANIESAVTDFKAALKAHNIPLKISSGGEVRISVEAISMVRHTQIPMLGHENGYDIMLLEFPHSHILPGSDKLVAHLLNQNIRPMIAHPERNKDVMRSLDKLLPFVEAGCLLQLTAGSVAGSFGKFARQRAIEMLERGWVTVLASDAHNHKYRPPDLRAGRDAAAAIIGEAAAMDLVLGRPASILHGWGQV